MTWRSFISTTWQQFAPGATEAWMHQKWRTPVDSSTSFVHGMRPAA